MLTDLRLGLRLLVRQPFLALTAIVALTVGIGLATVGFATMEAMLFSRLPFEAGNRFVRLSPVQLDEETYTRLAAAPALEHLGATTTARIDDLIVASLTPESFRYLSAVPVAGRLLGPDDAVPGAARVALVSERYWEKARPAGTPAVGATIDLSGTTHTVVGLMPASFEFPSTPDVWLPLALPAGDARLFGIRAADQTLDQLNTQLATIAAQFPTTDPTPITIQATEFTDLGDMAPLLSSVIVIAVVAVLIVIAANVGNLVLARSFARTREFALRSALGASQGRLVIQVMAEVVVLGVIAAALGSLGAHAVLRQFNAMPDIPFWVDFTGGPLTFLLVSVTTVLATAIAGAWPAFKATRQDVTHGLQGGDGRSSDVRFGRLSGAMVVAQIAVSVIMLHGALVVAQAFRNYTTTQIALPGNVLTMGMSVSPSLRAPDVVRIAATQPGVIAAGVTTALPRHSPAARSVEVEAVPGAPPVAVRRAPSAAVSPTYFDALGATASTGRLFTDADMQPNAPAVAIVNEPFAREVLAGTALGRRFRVIDAGMPGPWIEVVGVVPDLGLSVGDPALAAGFYVPLPPDAEVVYLAARVTGEPLQFAPALREALRRQDAGVSLFRAERLEDVASEDRAFFAGFSSALVGIGATTLILALAGVYSMMSLIVSRRTREIGIRLALGASVRQVVSTIGGRAAFQVAIGGVLGAALAVVSLNARSILVSRMGDGGPWTLPVVLGLLVVAGLAATWVPLRRALRIRPQDALRAD